MAPAHELFIIARVAWPSCRIFSATISSLRNSSGRRPMKPCVAMAESASNGMSTLPNPVSRPQMATTMEAGTLYCFWIAASCGASSFISVRPVAASALRAVGVEIAGWRLELRLAARLHLIGEHLGQRRPARDCRVGIDEMRQRPIELEPLGVGIEHGTADAQGFRIGPQRLHPRGEALIHRALIDCDLVLGGFGPGRMAGRA